MTEKVHIPPRCTCSRMVWLGEHCKEFSLKIEGAGFVIRAAMNGPEDGYVSSGPLNTIGETIGECFADMWNAWMPEEGVKA